MKALFNYLKNTIQCHTVTLHTNIEYAEHIKIASQDNYVMIWLRDNNILAITTPYGCPTVIDLQNPDSIKEIEKVIEKAKWMA